MSAMTGAMGMHVVATRGRRGHARYAPLIAAVAIATLAMSGCSGDDPEDVASPSPTASALPGPSSSPVETVSPEPSESPSETAAPEPSPDPLSGLPVGVACEDLLTAQDVYDYNPNVGTDPGYRPRVGSGPEKTRELSGVACGWLNQTSGQTYSIGVARFEASELERVRAMVSQEGGDALGGGLDGTYRVESGVGVIELFVGSYWVSAESSAFLGVEDAQPLLDAIERNLS